MSLQFPWLGNAVRPYSMGRRKLTGERGGQPLPLLDRWRGEAGEAGEARSGLGVGVPERRSASILEDGPRLRDGDSALAGQLSPSGSGRTRLTSGAGLESERAR